MRRMWIAMVLAGALLVPGIRAVSAGQERPSPTVAYVVKHGDTLWKIAGSVDPQGDRRRTIHRLIELNDLASATLTAGQRIELPTR